MTHRYGHEISVIATASGEPVRLEWRDTAFRVAEVLARWHLRDRWWDPDTASDRHYYRLQCADGLLCDVYYDSVSGRWILDRVHD
jgi:hypothetical protein